MQGSVAARPPSSGSSTQEGGAAKQKRKKKRLNKNQKKKLERQKKDTQPLDRQQRNGEIVAESTPELSQEGDPEEDFKNVGQDIIEEQSMEDTEFEQEPKDESFSVTRRKIFSFDKKAGKMWIPFWLLIPVIAFLVFANGLDGQLVYDDRAAVDENKDILPETPWSDMWYHDYWGNPINTPGKWTHKVLLYSSFRANLIQVLQSYRPIATLSFRLNYMIHGKASFGYHLVNVILHSVASLLVYFVGMIIFSNERLLSAIAALLFATHPIHTDAIDSIVGRAEALYAVFFFASFLTYALSTNYSFSQQPAPSRTTTSWPWLIVSMVCFVLSVLSKEMGVAVLPLCVGYDLLYKCNAWQVIFVKRKFHKLLSGTLSSHIKYHL